MPLRATLSTQLARRLGGRHNWLATVPDKPLKQLVHGRTPVSITTSTSSRAVAQPNPLRVQWRWARQPPTKLSEQRHRIPLLDLILSAFLDPRFVVGYCLLIFTLFTLFVFKITSEKRRLARALEFLNKEWAEGPDKDDFVENFEEYREKILDQPALRRAWHEFEETLVKPSAGTIGEIRNTSDVSSYLNHATVVSPNVSFNYYRSVPNLLTGLGILGTFLGLASGVNAASSGLSSSTPQEITTSLHQLLQGSSLAFFTSIVGISLSIISVLINAKISQTLDRMLANLVDNIESKLTRVTPASVALDQLEEARESRFQLEKFNTDLVFSIRQTLEDNIANRLSPQLTKLLEAIESLRDDRATDSANVIAKMTDQFAEVLREQAGNQFDRLGVTVDRLSETLQQSTEALEEAQKQTRDTMVSNTTKVADQIAEAGQTLVTNVTDQLQQALGDLGSATADHFNHMKSTLHDLDTMTRTLNTSMSESQAKARDSIEEGASAMVASVASVTQRASKHITDAMANSVTDLRSATNQLSTAVNTGKSLIESMNTFVEKFSDLAIVIEDTHTQIAGTTVPLTESVIAIRSATQQHSNLVRQSRDCVVEIGTTLDQLKQYADSVQRTWEDYSKRFSGIDESLENVFDEFHTGLSSYIDKTNTFVGEIDKTAGNCISQLAAANRELSVYIQELSDVLEERQL